MRQRNRRWGRRGAVVAVSVAAHLAVAVVMLRPGAAGPVFVVPETIEVTMEPPPVVRTEAPEPAVEQPGAAQASAPVAEPQAVPTTPVVRVPVRQAVPVERVEPVPIAAAAVAPGPVTVDEAGLVGARVAGAAGTGDGSAGSGAGSGADGGRCDMVRLLQDALREDAEVMAALSEANRAAGAKALLVWDGDWVRNGAQEGKGLAGVRQAISLEVAFAPAACRREAMRGRVLISMADGPGAARLVLGSGSWRWSDLLSARR